MTDMGLRPPPLFQRLERRSRPDLIHRSLILTYVSAGLGSPRRRRQYDLQLLTHASPHSTRPSGSARPGVHLNSPPGSITSKVMVRTAARQVAATVSHVHHDSRLAVRHVNVQPVHAVLLATCRSSGSERVVAYAASSFDPVPPRRCLDSSLSLSQESFCARAAKMAARLAHRKILAAAPPASKNLAVGTVANVGLGGHVVGGTFPIISPDVDAPRTAAHLTQTHTQHKDQQR